MRKSMMKLIGDDEQEQHDDVVDVDNVDCK